MKVMKKLFFTTSIVTCVILAAGCATVKENGEEKNESNVIDYGSFQKTTYTDDFGREGQRYEGDQDSIIKHITGGASSSLKEFRTDSQNQLDAGCRKKVSVFPNPTSSSATIEIDFWKDMKIEGTIFETIPISFQYNLIFEQKIIHTDYIEKHKGQIAIPESLLQKEGVYTVAFEFFQEEEKNSSCKNSISFMVRKTK